MHEPGMALVTGGGRGIGAAICRKLAAVGYAVAVNYGSNEAAADAVVAGIVAAGGQAQKFAGDVADERDVQRMFMAAEAGLGPLAALVNNAGILGELRRTDELDCTGIDRLFAVNVRGTMLCAGEAVKRLSTRHGGVGGAIVNVSSVLARLGGLAGRLPYAASKGAVETFTRGLAIEVAREGIRVNAVAPGMTATDMISAEMRAAIEPQVPLGRLGEPDDIAEAVLWLLSPAACYVTGQVLTVSGGR
jgi:NAD(P)-dependent dehydrogenase (short-subunit alcohol dehydrogenase family)